MNKAQQHRSEYFYVQHLIHLTLQGKRPATIDAYTRALRRITHQLDKSPDTLKTDDLKRYFAQLIKTHSWSTVKIDRNGLQFFKHALQHYWRWILQNIIPKGFRRVRDYGLLRGHEKKQLQAIQFMFMLTGQLTLPSTNNTVRIKAQPCCPCCQHVMQLTGIFRPK
uniref:phage integrase N-terminal SAM-like domain-containing protein n=1 Tax=Photobacterium leiognathi TaxID=553611 RepID=UPI00387EAF34